MAKTSHPVGHQSRPVGHRAWVEPLETRQLLSTAALPVIDGTVYSGKPDLVAEGMSRPVYVATFELFATEWGPNIDYREPVEFAVRAAARAAAQLRQPFVIDVEHWPLDIRRASTATVDLSIARMKRIIGWVREEAPEVPVGIYAFLPVRDYNTPVILNDWKQAYPNNPEVWANAQADYDRWTRANDYLATRLAPAVDIVYPSLYTFDTDPADWQVYAKANIAQARKFGKPVVPFLAPIYHISVRNLGKQPIEPAFWRVQLQTMKDYADGTVVWAGHNLELENRTDWRLPWRNDLGWWSTTRTFIENELRSPQAPVLAGSPQSSSQIKLYWTDNTNTESGFKIQRSTSSTFSNVTEIRLGANETSYRNSGLAAGTTYYYRVASVHGSGSSDYSNVIARKTSGTAPTPPPSTSVTRYATHDTYVRDGSFATRNFGRSTVLETKRGGTSNNRYTYLKFDLSNLSTIGTAKLRLYGHLGATGGSNVPASVYAMSNTGWTENGITWNNRPASGTSALATRTITNTTWRWYEWDLSAYARQLKTAGKNVMSVAIRNRVSSTPQAVFKSAESGSNVPRLVISRTATSTTITRGAAHDAYVRGGSYASRNFGGASTLETKRNSNASVNRYTYLKFDIRNLSNVSRAKLRLYGHLAATGGSNIPTSVYASSNTSWSESTITWNNRPSSGTTALATRTITDTTWRWYEWDLTSYVRQQKAAGKSVITLALRNTVSSSPQTVFKSAESGSNVPRLVITT